MRGGHLFLGLMEGFQGDWDFLWRAMEVRSFSDLSHREVGSWVSGRLELSMANFLLSGPSLEDVELRRDDQQIVQPCGCGGSG